MADKKISELTGATTPIAGTEVLPIVQSSITKKIASDDLTVKNIRSNATTGILQVAGPAAAATRTMTTPDANFTVARTDAAQTFTGQQTFSSDARVNSLTVGRGAGTGASNVAYGQNALNNATTGAYNIAIGDFSFGTGNRTNSIAIGFQAGYAATGSQGVYVGNYAGFNTTGTNNFFFGYDAGTNVTSGAYNVILGSYKGDTAPISATGSNYAVISDAGGNVKAYGDGSNNWVVPTGNLIIGTSGKGIDFSATGNAAGMTSELLADYEEGTWTPTDSSAAGLVFTSALGSYTKVGRLVTAAFEVTYPATADVLTARVSLPITSVTSNSITGMFLTLTNYGSSITGITSSTFMQFYDVNLNSLKNNNLSGKLFRGVLVYYT